MAQACDGYSKISVMGNWYEERLANQQPSRLNPEKKMVRQVEEAISFATAQGELKPLARINRSIPWDTTGIVANDGFKEMRSENSTKFDQQNLDNYFRDTNYKTLYKQNTETLKYPECNPYSIQLQEYKKPNMLNTDNIHEVMQNQRDVKFNRTDFGSTFRKHEQDKERFFHMTTYNEQLGQTTKESHFDKFNRSKKTAGYNERPLTQQGMKMTSVLTAEKYKNEYDPKDNTSVQRSWLPFQDKSVLYANKNLETNKLKNETNGLVVRDQLQTYRQNNYQVKQHDIATSLPLEDGYHKLQEKYTNSGQFRRIRTDITQVKNKPLLKR